MIKNKHILGIICALAANVIFGFSFIFSKNALAVSHPLVILAVRFTVAFLSINLLLCLGVFKIDFKILKNPLLWALGLAQPLFYFIFELYGLSLVSSALSGVIIALVPVAVMLLSRVFLKEKPTLLQWIFTLVSILGVSLISIISNDGEQNYILGILLLIGAVFCAAVFNILSRKQADTCSPFERTYMMFLVGTLGFNITAVIALKENYIPLVLTSITNTKFIIAIIYLAIVSSVMAFLLYNFATSNITAIEASSFSNIIPVVTVIAGVIILKEEMTLLGYILCGLIILGVWGVNKFTKNFKKN
jgi:drug/metabolite transporter (DMT)-like permease